MPLELVLLEEYSEQVSVCQLVGPVNPCPQTLYGSLMLVQQECLVVKTRNLLNRDIKNPILLVANASYEVDCLSSHHDLFSQLI